MKYILSTLPLSNSVHSLGDKFLHLCATHSICISYQAASLLDLPPETEGAWSKQYSKRLEKEVQDEAQRQQQMKQVNPKYILRNYMAETAIRKAEDENDYSEIDKFMTILQSPYDKHPEHEDYAGFPPGWATQLAVNCSS